MIQLRLLFEGGSFFLRSRYVWLLIEGGYYLSKYGMYILYMYVLHLPILFLSLSLSFSLSHTHKHTHMHTHTHTYTHTHSHTHTYSPQYAALDSTATNLAVAGKAGFALYSGSRRRWKLFGNEVQEQGLTCRGGLAWYKDIVVFPCRVQERDEEVQCTTCNTSVCIQVHVQYMYVSLVMTELILLYK